MHTLNPFLYISILALAVPLPAQPTDGPRTEPRTEPSNQPSNVPATVPGLMSGTAAQNATPLADGDLERLLSGRPLLDQTLTLDEAVTIAMRDSPVVRGAAEEVEEALGRLNAARAEKRPTLT